MKEISGETTLKRAGAWKINYQNAGGIRLCRACLPNKADAVAVFEQVLSKIYHRNRMGPKGISEARVK